MLAIIKSVSFILLLFLVGAAIAYYAVGAGLKPMTAEAREAAPGEFLVTSQGVLHYRWHGPENGDVIVMAHGFSTPNFIFEQNAEALASAGHRVLTFDHFGRGWSDRPTTDYTADFYDREVLDLVDGLGLTQPFGLVGLSMGGPITAEFTARHSERVSKLFLFVPAGLAISTEQGSFTDRMMRTPIIGDWVWRMMGKSILLGDDQYDESSIPAANRLAGDVTAQMEYEGYLEALLSSYRYFPMQDRNELFTRLAATDITVRAVFGEQDTTVLIESADQLNELMPEADIVRIAEGGHGLNYQMSETSNALLLEFFAPETEQVPTPE